MKIPAPNINWWLRSHPVSSPRGAPMGALDITGDGLEGLHLQRLRFVDDCYDLSGVYWGLPADVWCAFGTYMGTMLHVRAPSRVAARLALTERYPGISFKRG